MWTKKPLAVKVAAHSPAHAQLPALHGVGGRDPTASVASVPSSGSKFGLHLPAGRADERLRVTSWPVLPTPHEREEDY